MAAQEDMYFMTECGQCYRQMMEAPIGSLDKISLLGMAFGQKKKSQGSLCGE